MDRNHKNNEILRVEKVPQDEEQEFDFYQAEQFVIEHIGQIDFQLIRQISFDQQKTKPKSIYGVYEIQLFKSFYKVEDIRNEAVKLERNYNWHLGVRGDGNCFYRSIIILYIGRLFESNELLSNFIRQVYGLTKIESSLISKKIISDDLKAIFLGFLLFLVEIKKEGVVQNFQELIFFYNHLPEVDLAAIVITRFMIYQQYDLMKQDPTRKYFIEERMWKEGKDLILKYFECAEDVIISLAASVINHSIKLLFIYHDNQNVLIKKAFNCNINVQHFYRTNDQGNHQKFVNKMEQYKPNHQNPKTSLSVLFLNGHYEALLGRNQDPFYQLERFNETLASDIVRNKVFFDLFNRVPNTKKTSFENLTSQKKTEIRASSAEIKQHQFRLSTSKIMQNDNPKMSQSSIKEPFISPKGTQNKKFKDEINKTDSLENKQYVQGILKENEYFEETKLLNQFKHVQQVDTKKQQIQSPRQRQQNPLQKLQKSEDEKVLISEQSKSINDNKEKQPYQQQANNNQKYHQDQPSQEIPSREVKMQKVKPNESYKDEKEAACFICFYGQEKDVPLEFEAKHINVCGQCMKEVIQKGILEKRKLIHQDLQIQNEQNVVNENDVSLHNKKGIPEQNDSKQKEKIQINSQKDKISENPGNLENNQQTCQNSLNNLEQSRITLNDKYNNLAQNQQQSQSNEIEQKIIKSEKEQYQSENKVVSSSSQNKKTEVFLTGFTYCLLCNKQGYSGMYLKDKLSRKDYGICESCVQNQLIFEDIQDENSVKLNLRVFEFSSKVKIALQKLISEQQFQKQVLENNKSREVKRQKLEEMKSDQSEKYLQLEKNKPISQTQVFNIQDYLNTDICIKCRSKAIPQAIKLYLIKFCPKNGRQQHVRICSICLSSQELSNQLEFEFQNEKFIVEKYAVESISYEKKQQERQIRESSRDSFRNQTNEKQVIDPKRGIYFPQDHNSPKIHYKFPIKISTYSDHNLYNLEKQKPVQSQTMERKNRYQLNYQTLNN